MDNVLKIGPTGPTGSIVEPSTKPVKLVAQPSEPNSSKPLPISILIVQKQSAETPKVHLELPPTIGIKKNKNQNQKKRY